MPDIDSIHKMIDERIAELEPRVAEYQELLTLRARMAGDLRRYSTAERKQQVLKHVRDEPGVRIKDLARGLGVSVPRVVQVVNELESERMLERTTQGLRLRDNFKPNREEEEHGRS